MANTSRTGDITELTVCTKLLEKGFEVMRNVSSVGLIDIVVYSPKTKKIYLFDVKTCNPYVREDQSINFATGYLNKEQIKIGVEICFLWENNVFIKKEKEIIDILDYDVLGDT